MQWGPERSPRLVTRSSGLPLGDVRVANNGGDPVGDAIGRKLLRLGQVLRLPDQDVRQLTSLAGQVVDLSLRIDIDIAADGAVDLSYRYHILNLTDQPFTRLPREIWFQSAMVRLI